MAKPCIFDQVLLLYPAFGSGQLHSSLAGGSAVQGEMDGVLLPAPPLDPDPPLDW